MADTTFEEWAIVDLYGHTRLAGRVTEATLAGGSFLRLDIPGEGDKFTMTKFIGPSSIFELTLVTKETAQAFARHYQPQPATRWELSLPHVRDLGSDREDEP